MVNESCIVDPLSQLERRAYKMKMKSRIVATAIPRTHDKRAVAENFRVYAELSSARLRPLRALVAAI
jgi:hypothetical protein